MTLFSTLVIAGGRYFFTSVFYRATTAQYRANMEDFFTRPQTPFEKEGVEDVQERLTGSSAFCA